MVSAATFAVAKAMSENHADDLRALQNKIAALEAQNASLKERVVQLTLLHTLEQANVAGLAEEIEVVRIHHPNSPVFKQAGTFEDGSPRTQLELAFMVGFDNKAKELGITNPRQFRRR